jgi:putative addiction module component (TIGR02574 family)
MTAAEVIRAAMELSPAERQDVALALMRSVDESADLEEVAAAWRTEIGGRIEALREGRATLLSRDDLDRFLDQQGARRAV